VQYVKDNANAILWITRYITALISMRKFMRKSYRDVNQEDIRALIDFIENHQLYLRLFCKVVYGNNKFYPEQVNWFSIKVSKDKSRNYFTLDMAEYLDEDQIKILIKSASSVKRRAVILHRVLIRLLYLV